MQAIRLRVSVCALSKTDAVSKHNFKQKLLINSRLHLNKNKNQKECKRCKYLTATFILVASKTKYMKN